MCLALKHPIPDAVMRKEPGPHQRSCLVQQVLHPAKVIRGWWGDFSIIRSKKWPMYFKVAPSRSNIPTHLWGQIPGWLSPGDRSRTLPRRCGRTPLAALVIWPRYPPQRKTKTLLPRVSLFALLYPLHHYQKRQDGGAGQREEPGAACRLWQHGAVFQGRHRALRAGPFKGCIFLFQLFGRQHLTRHQVHHLSCSLCIWSSLPVPLILIIKFYVWEFSFKTQLQWQWLCEKTKK